MSELERISISIEKPLLDRLEKLVSTGEYSNRSEFVRDLIRGYLVDEQFNGEAMTLGTISLVYDHHVKGLNAKLTHQQHHFTGKVLATTHVHLDEHLCAEMIMVKGRGVDIRSLAGRLGREKGVLHAKLAAGTTGSDLG